MVVGAGAVVARVAPDAVSGDGVAGRVVVVAAVVAVVLITSVVKGPQECGQDVTPQDHHVPDHAHTLASARSAPR